MARRRDRSNGFLPPHVYRFKSQHGTDRLRFVKTGMKSGYFKAPFGTKSFWAEYEAFLNPDAAQQDKAVLPRFTPGSIDDLISQYISVPERLGPSAVTQDKIRAILEDFRDGTNAKGERRGSFPVALVTFDAIDRIIAKKRIKTGSGNKTKGGIHAAIKLRKELHRLFHFAVKKGFISKNPVEFAERVRIPAAERSRGFHSWTEDEIQQFRDHWQLGTRERLALELFLWTDQRRCDVHRMGRAQIRDGRLPVVQQKTGKTLWIAVAPQLLEAIVALPKELTSPFCFIVSRKGTAYTKESFGNWFKDACVAAGLPHCSAHGLRKATLRRMAELRLSNKAMKSVSGQDRDETLAIYTADADQVALADHAITELARWDMRASKGDSVTEYRFTAND